MKLAQTDTATPDRRDADVRAVEAEVASTTRNRVLRTLVQDGPATAASLAERLALTPGAVRRHLDALVDQGRVRAGERPPYGPAAPRGRGRPARVYSVTEEGRALQAQDYDALAVEVLRFLSRREGPEAVAEFARQRLEPQAQRFRQALEGVPPTQRPTVLADLLTRDGFAASVEPVSGPLPGVQICQHHCPVAHVAAEFPQLCEAESAMFADVLDTHVQRLATIAQGTDVCTTHLPHQPVDVVSAGPLQSRDRSPR